MTTFKRNDTWPPLRGKATDDDGYIPLADADSLKVLLKSGTTLIEGVAVAIDPPDSDGMNFSYTWDDNDLDITGTYQVELEITWNSATSPPEVETVPNVGYATLIIVADLG